MALTKITSTNIQPGAIESSSLELSGAAAGTYGAAAKIPVLSVNAQGIVFAISEVDVAGVTNFTYDSGAESLTIDTADGGSFTADISSLASETYVDNAISNLINSAPAALDTLDELAAALGDDANFASTVTNSLAGKVDKINGSGGTVGSSTAIPVITYNAQGQITSASTTTVAGIDNVTFSNGTLMIETGDGTDYTTDLDARYFTETEANANFLGINAKAADSDLLDGQQGSYYLNYNNFSNTPDAVSVYDTNTASTGFFDLPSGTTAQRPASASPGYLRYNTDIGLLEQYNAAGWQPIDSPPTVAGVSPTSYDGDAGSLFTISGSNFKTGSIVEFITSSGGSYNASSTTIVNNSTIEATTPVAFTVADEPISIKVINPSGLSSLLQNAIDAGNIPVWSTASGSLGTFTEGSAVSASVSASDPDGQTISYTLASGALPSGVTLASNGTISGTPQAVPADTTYSFVINASDTAGNSVGRSFSITITATNYFGDGSDGTGSF